MGYVVNPSELKTRALWCKLTLQSGEFNQGNNSLIVNANSSENTPTLMARVHKTLSSDNTNSADITIFGMNESDIAALSTLGYEQNVYELNRIELYAQYEGGLPSLSFSGYIVKAYADFSDVNRPMHFECQTTYLDAIKIAQATNAKGTFFIQDLFSSYADSLSLSFKNNGVKGIIENPLFTGGMMDQIKDLSEQTSTICVVDNGIMKICPLGFALSDEELDVSAETELLSYPIIDTWGVKLRIRYTPTLELGQYIKLTTIVPIPKSNGRWYVYDMQSELSNNHDPWFTDLRCAYNGLNFGRDNG